MSLPRAPRARRKLAAAACVLIGAALSAGCDCEDSSATPDRALKRFLRAAAKGDTAEVFAAIAPRQQARLRELARRATAYASGRRRFAPPDLLATSLTDPGTVSAIEVISVEGDRAKVRLRDNKRKRTEDWQLLRVEKTWRVLLPAKVLAAASAAAAPSSRDRTQSGDRTRSGDRAQPGDQ